MKSQLSGSAPVCFFSQKGDSPTKKLVESWQRKKEGKGEWLSGTVLKPCEHAVLAGR